MTGTGHTAVPARRGAGLWPHRFASVAAAALVAVFTLAYAAPGPESMSSDGASRRKARCEHDGGIAIERLAAHGLDLRTAKWRRDRERSVAACMEGFRDLRWLGS